MDLGSYDYLNDNLFCTFTDDNSNKLVDNKEEYNLSYKLFFNDGVYEDCVDCNYGSNNCINRINNILSSDKNFEKHLEELKKSLELLDEMIDLKNKIKNGQSYL